MKTPGPLLFMRFVLGGGILVRPCSTEICILYIIAKKAGILVIWNCMLYSGYSNCVSKFVYQAWFCGILLFWNLYIGVSDPLLQGPMSILVPQLDKSLSTTFARLSAYTPWLQTHTDKTLRPVMTTLYSLLRTGELGQANTRTDGRYQVHYLPRFAIDK